MSGRRKVRPSPARRGSARERLPSSATLSLNAKASSLLSRARGRSSRSMPLWVQKSMKKSFRSTLSRLCLGRTLLGLSSDAIAGRLNEAWERQNEAVLSKENV